MRRLVLILLPLFPMLFFQNCQKKQSGSFSSYEECLKSGSFNCGLVAANGELVPSMNLGNSTINLNSLGMGAGAYSVDVATNRATNNTTSATCTLNHNSKWQELKALYLQNGICEYRYELPPGTVRCMAYAIPFASVTNQSNSNEIHLAGSICQTDHFHICGQANQQTFQNALQELETQLSNNTGCD